MARGATPSTRFPSLWSAPSHSALPPARGGYYFLSMSVSQVIAEIEVLPEAERAEVAAAALKQLPPERLVNLERLLRRLAHPDVPESFWDGVEDCEDGRTVDMETALYEDPPE